jgi:glycosyltransferase involved in cell wall biosynthesis
MLRVYHLIKGLGRGGAETLLVENLRFSDRTHFEYGYGYFLPWKNALELPLEAQGAQVDCFECGNSLSILAAARRVSTHLRHWRADLLHCHLPMAGVVGRIAGRMSGIPVVYTEHNRMERYHPLTRHVNLLTWKWQDLVIAVSDEVSNSIHAHTNGATPVRVILNGVDTDRFEKTSTDSGRVRRELSIPPTAPVIGTVAVFRSQKRLQDWLSAARLLKDRHPDARFLLVGDGPLGDELRRQARESGLDDVLYFPGLQQDVRPYLAAMDLFMMSSVFEGLPVALLEAMAMRCGIVSTDVGGIPEVIRNGENGVLVEPRDPIALADAASELIRDPARMDRMGRAARDATERRFGMRRMTHELEESYQAVLRNGRHAP